MLRTSKRNFARRNKTAFGPGDRMRLLSKVSDDKQPLFRSLSEFYIIIFQNKLKIVENSPQKWKSQNKTSMAKAFGLFRDSRALSWVPGPRIDVSAEPPSHMPC